MAQAQTARNLNNILSKSPGEVDRPKPIPVGTYHFAVDGRPKFDESARKKTPYVEFTCKILGAGDDVDADDLKTALTKPSGESVKLNTKSMRLTFYTTEDALWRLKKFLVDLGLDIEGEEKSFEAWIDETPGCQFLGTVKHTTSEDGEATYANISGTAKVGKDD